MGLVPGEDGPEPGEPGTGEDNLDPASGEGDPEFDPDLDCADSESELLSRLRS